MKIKGKGIICIEACAEVLSAIVLYAENLHDTKAKSLAINAIT